jgi:hypothetical protein
MSIKSVKLKTSKSNEYLGLAKRYLKQAESLSEGDDKRQWLEEEANRLFNEAKELSDQAKQAVSTYSHNI